MDQTSRAERRRRWRTLRQLESWLEQPMIFLGLLWLALLVVELTRGLSPALQTASLVIWIVFIVDFTLRLFLAPDRRRYLKRNWLTALSLVLPALRVVRAIRVLRVLRAGRSLRGLRLVRVVGSINRSISAVGTAMQQRHLGYVLVITAVVVFAGAAGMLAFERSADAGPTAIRGYGEALWWTTMIMTTLGTDYWPRTPEGRILCILLALYAFAVFGYVTASLATFLIGVDVRRRRVEMQPPAELLAAVAALRDEVARLRNELRDRTPGGRLVE